MEEGKGQIIPLCVPEIDKGKLPEPLGRLNAMSLGKAVESKAVFEALIDQFGFWENLGVQARQDKAKLPRYRDLTVAEADLQSGTIYSGPYAGYSEEELTLVVEDKLVKPHWSQEAMRPYASENLLTGKLTHFKELDEQHALPPGTAKKHLAAVVEAEYPIRVARETDNTIRFEEGNWRNGRNGWPRRATTSGNQLTRYLALIAGSGGIEQSHPANGRPGSPGASASRA